MLALADSAAAQSTPSGSNSSATSKTRPALVVTTVQPAQRELDDVLVANGSIAAWQEAIVGAELAGARIARLQADIGQRAGGGRDCGVEPAGFAQRDQVADQGVAGVPGF